LGAAGFLSAAFFSVFVNLTVPERPKIN
jgi:hypothetical protein